MDLRRGVSLKVLPYTFPKNVRATKENPFIKAGTTTWFSPSDRLPKAVEHQHMTFTEAAEVAKKAEAAELWLTHYSPSLNRPEEYMKTVTDIFANAYPGKDGKSTELMFEGEA